ncbi:MAG: hypothetical protein IJO98_01585 [Clostridia bacterium]|nr:hypothetical protein [Clostridia bacterium]
MTIDGCEARHATPVLEERICPECGDIVEVFTRKGRIIADCHCDCGHVFPEEEQIFTRARRKDA